VALGIREDERREVLGWWLERSEGESADIWNKILQELKEKGVRKVHLFATAGLKGFKETIMRYFSSSMYQRYTLHTLQGKVIEILPDEENADKILFPIFFDLNEKSQKRKLPNFEFIFSQTFHSLTQEVIL